MKKVLLIGLGGTGCQVVSQVKQMVRSAESNYGVDPTIKIRFLGFDTDSNQEDAPNLEVIRTSRDSSVNTLLRQEPNWQEWFPNHPMLFPHNMLKGAGQIRVLSRLAFSDHFDHDTQSVTESTLYTCLGSALEEYTRSLRQDPAMEQSALSVQYHYLPLEDCDVHERHRSVCRLLLFVYALAADGNMPGFFDMSRQAQAGRLQQNDLGPLHACLVPEMDRQRLGQTLLLRLERCQGAAYQQAELPPELSKQEGRQKEARIRSEYAVPALVPKSLDIPRERRESPGASMAEALTRRALRLEELKNAVQRTLAAVLEKNSRNQQDIAEYLNRVGSEYNRSKDEALRQFVSQGSVPALQAFQGQNADQYIDELQNIQDRMGEEKKRLEKAILQAPRRLVTTADMTRAVQAVEKQTDYYFRALRVGWTLALSGVGFVLLFLVPYAAIARQLFSSPLGYLFFPLTALGLSGACIAGFARFSRACKRKIIRMVRQLVDDFAASQKNNQDCLEQFGEFLYRSIPQYCALCQYEETLRQYKTALQQRREQITYHNTSRERQSARIRKLLDDLDIVSVPQKPAALPETFLINPEADRIANRDVYLLSAQNVRDILGIAPKRSQEA